MKYLIALSLTVLLVGCTAPVNLPTVTPPPTDIPDPTPTQEAPTATPTRWIRPPDNTDDGAGCIKPEELDLVQNNNPCLAGSEVQTIGNYTMVHPRGMPYRAYRGITGQWGTSVSLGSAFDIDMGYFAGSIGLLANDILLDQNVCYVIDIWYEVKVRSITEPNTAKMNQNYTVNVALHLDTGRVVYLNQQNLGEEIHNPDTSIVWDMGQFPNSKTLRQRLYPFWTNIAGLSAKPEALVNALFAMAEHESTISFVSFSVKRLPEPGGTGNCNGITALEWRPLATVME